MHLCNFIGSIEITSSCKAKRKIIPTLLIIFPSYRRRSRLYELDVVIYFLIMRNFKLLLPREHKHNKMYHAITFLLNDCIRIAKYVQYNRNKKKIANAVLLNE